MGAGTGQTSALLLGQSIKVLFAQSIKGSCSHRKRGSLFSQRERDLGGREEAGDFLFPKSDREMTLLN